MAETTTVARPYAEGVFQIARERDALPAWSDMLDLAAAVVADDRMVYLLGSPKLTTEQKIDLVLDVCGDRLDDEGRNLIRLLTTNNRLMLLPDIARQYQGLRADHERTVEATLYTAQSVDDAAREKIAAALSKRLDRTVKLDVEIDEGLVGGAIIRAGDLVIDGSVRGRIERLAGALSR